MLPRSNTVDKGYNRDKHQERHHDPRNPGQLPENMDERRLVGAARVKNGDEGNYNEQDEGEAGDHCKGDRGPFVNVPYVFEQPDEEQDHRYLDKGWEESDDDGNAPSHQALIPELPQPDSIAEGDMLGNQDVTKPLLNCDGEECCDDTQSKAEIPKCIDLHRIGLWSWWVCIGPRRAISQDT